MANNLEKAPIHVRATVSGHIIQIERERQEPAINGLALAASEVKSSVFTGNFFARAPFNWCSALLRRCTRCWCRCRRFEVDPNIISRHLRVQKPIGKQRNQNECHHLTTHTATTGNNKKR